MRNLFSTVAGLALLVIGLATPPSSAQQLNNDGFQRHNGQMQILRNGQLRPMTRDARLPTGAVVTKDGFVVSRDGRRTELREGQGCDLRGNIVAVVPTASGLALSSRAAGSRGASNAPAVGQVREVLEDLLGGGRRYEEGDDDYDEEYSKKAEERAREQRKKEEEWRREEEKHREERGKKWKEKWKKGKHWDD
ncbi:DUF6799 domain-containing protein [Hymenobacter koreensis]|uniref:DUF6799 domain-containing protein n=1 Tax=Hymenobacter koreensis TaxID=1084523 RepID=A0ABP8JKV2_9BACT